MASHARTTRIVLTPAAARERAQLSATLVVVLTLACTALALLDLLELAGLV